jgi:hypothetical protein
LDEGDGDTERFGVGASSSSSSTAESTAWTSSAISSSSLCCSFWIEPEREPARREREEADGDRDLASFSAVAATDVVLLDREGLADLLGVMTASASSPSPAAAAEAASKVEDAGAVAAAAVMREDLETDAEAGRLLAGGVGVVGIATACVASESGVAVAGLFDLRAEVGRLDKDGWGC